MITKGERTELRSIVRQQFKVLRLEVMQRDGPTPRVDLPQRPQDRFQPVTRASLKDVQFLLATLLGHTPQSAATY